MDGEAEPTMRLHLHVSHAVQGELFPSADAQSVTRGYRGTVASKVAGITYRQLDYWARKQIVEPSITPSHGSGSRRLYSFKDVVILAVSKRLLDAGINLQNVTTAIGFLAQRTPEQLAGITIMCDGQNVHECTDSEQMVALLQSGRAVFGVSVGSLWHQIKEALEHEEYVDLTKTPASTDTNKANRRHCRDTYEKEAGIATQIPRSSLIAYNWYDSARNIRTI